LAALYQGIDIALSLLEAVFRGELHYQIVVVFERIGSSSFGTAKRITTGFVLMRWNLCDQKGREKMDPGRCVLPAEVPGRKTKDGLSLPARLVILEPIPKVGLYKIAHYYRLIPAQKSANRSKHSSLTARNGAGATVSQFYIRNKTDARRCITDTGRHAKPLCAIDGAA
jgi:hypothetical protein